MFGRGAGAEVEARARVGGRAALAVGVEEAAAGQEGEEVEVGVLLAPEDAAVDLLGGERDVSQGPGDVGPARDGVGEARGVEAEGDGGAAQEGFARAVQGVAEGEVGVGEAREFFGPEVVGVNLGVLELQLPVGVEGRGEVALLEVGLPPAATACSVLGGVYPRWYQMSGRARLRLAASSRRVSCTKRS